MRRIFPLLILQHQPSIDTLLYLPLDLLRVVSISPIGKAPVHIPNRKGATIAPNWVTFLSDMHNNTHKSTGNEGKACMQLICMDNKAHCYWYSALLCSLGMVLHKLCALSALCPQATC